VDILGSGTAPAARNLRGAKWAHFAAVQSLQKLNLRCATATRDRSFVFTWSSDLRVETPQWFTKEKAMMKQTIVLRRAAIAVIAAASLSLPMMSSAQVQQCAARSWGKPMKSYAYYFAREPAQQCKIFDTISHRCLTFHSDSTWPEGLSDFHGGGVG
jgi:hypothetical protein